MHLAPEIARLSQLHRSLLGLNEVSRRISAPGPLGDRASGLLGCCASWQDWQAGTVPDDQISWPCPLRWSRAARYTPHGFVYYVKHRLILRSARFMLQVIIRARSMCASFYVDGDAQRQHVYCASFLQHNHACYDRSRCARKLFPQKRAARNSSCTLSASSVGYVE